MFDRPNGRRMGRQGRAWDGHIVARGGVGGQEAGLISVLAWRRDGQAIMRQGDLEGQWRVAAGGIDSGSANRPVHGWPVWSPRRGAVDMSSSGPIEWLVRGVWDMGDSVNYCAGFSS